MGISLQPGIPLNAPRININSSNFGWIYAHGAKPGDKNIEISLNKYSFDMKQGNLRIDIVKDQSSINAISDLIQSQGTGKQLILVLPDKNSMKYIEYKLWNAKMNITDSKHISFQSSDIVCLTGN